LHKFLLSFIAIGSHFLGQSQVNLVLNHSFEDTTQMTDGYPYLITTNWWSPNYASSDYFTPFDEQFNQSGSGGVLHAPMSQGLGFQVAQDGQAYVGMVTPQLDGETRDYVQGFLSLPMQAGETYCVGFWIAMSDSSGIQSCDFHVAFTSELIYPEHSYAMGLPNAMLFDIAGISGEDWTYFNGLYTAQGGEQYIYLGSQSVNAELDCIVPFSDAWLWNEAYVIVDNVSVVASEECTVGNTEVNLSTLRIYPNPTSDGVSIHVGHDRPFQLILYDMSGAAVLNVENLVSDQIVDLSHVSKGMYLAVCKTHQRLLREKIVIH